MNSLFFYGTLCHRPLLDAVLGPEAAGVTLTPARLPGHAVRWVAGQGYPMIVAAGGQAAEGLLASGLGAAAVARLDYYEGGHLYALREVEVATADGPRRARVYFPADPSLRPDGPFALAEWTGRWGEIVTHAAAEVMEGMGTVPPPAFLRRYPSILARAASQLRAGQAAPTTVRRRAEPGDVVVLERRRPYAGFFAVEDYRLTHRRFDGTQSPPLERTAFVSNDAVTVLPYDAARDRVLLVEQFRTGPFARGDAQCWSLEAIAGRIDPGETPEQAARREAREEAGLEIGALHFLAGYYPSPAAKTEFIYSYAALADLPDSAAGVGGAEDEGEDIRGHVLDFAHALALVESGEIGNAPLILSLLQLDRRRADLASGA